MLKKFILLKKRTQQTPFWQWIERRDKIRRLGSELDAITAGDFKEAHRIAKAQQELLQK